MTRNTLLRGAVLLALALGVTLSADAQDRARPAPLPAPTPGPAPKPAPRLVPVAETKLVMEGLAHANYLGLDRNLKEKPADVEAWTFVRGQALLVAESGNLLMIRPPRGDGQAAWMQRATDLREAAAALAKHAGNRDYDRAKAGLADVTNACNRCHQTFRVPVPIGPVPEKPEKKERDAE
jgi:hypothetical protein